MPNPTPCGPPCSPVVTNVPGPTGPTGLTGATGPAGPSSLDTYSVYGDSSSATFQLASHTVLASTYPTGILLSLSPVSPTLTLTDSGTYLIFARARFDGAALTLTTQTLTTYLYDTSVLGVIPNTLRVVAFKPQTALTGTVAEVVFPVVAYAATAGATIQIWGVMSAVTGAGTIVAVEADIIAVKIA